MIEAAVQQALKDHPAVAALVGDRVYPTTLPQAAVLPAVTYKQISLRSLGDTNDGPGDLFNPRFQIDAWSSDYLEAVSLAEAVRGVRGLRAVVAETEIQNVKLDGARFFFEADRELHHVAQDFFVWGKE
jgi:hypothetical protein